MEREEHLKLLADFLVEYRWIYDFKLTDFFIDKVWEQIPVEWIPCLLSLGVEEINQVPFGYEKGDWPESLHRFIQGSLSLPINRQRGEVTRGVKLDEVLRRGMNPKKQHEVSQMAALVHNLAQQTGSDVIVDVGSGLGYLGQTLSSRYGHTVIGVEGKECHTTSAEKRTLPSSKMTNLTFELQNTDQCMDDFKQALCDTLRQMDSHATMKQSMSEGEIIHKSYPETGAITTQTENRMKHTKGHRSCEKGQGMEDSDEKSPCEGQILFDKFNKNSICYDPRDGVKDCSICLSKGGLSESRDGVKDCSNCLSKGGLSESRDGVKDCSKSLSKGRLSESRDSVKDCSNCLSKGRLSESNPQNLESEKLNMCERPSQVACTCCHGNTNKETSLNYCCDDVSSVKPLHGLKSSSACGNHGNTTVNCYCENKFVKCCNVSNTSEYGGYGNTSRHSCHGDSSLGPKVLMIGLHCCGDLTPTMMRYFSRLDFISGLCCVSCCYHRMKSDDRTETFDNFPMSAALSSTMTERISIYALRLAAQETRSRWRNQSSKDHDYHMRNVAYRGLLELYCKQASCDNKKLFRKLTRRSDMSSFDTYIEAVLKRTDLVNDGEEVRQKLLDLHTEYGKYYDYIEPITMLQVMIQPVIETLIYLDRQQWLAENHHHGNIHPVFDDNVSPRNLALIAYKSDKCVIKVS